MTEQPRSTYLSSFAPVYSESMMLIGIKNNHYATRQCNLKQLYKFLLSVLPSVFFYLGMVRFDSDPEQYDSIPMLNNLEENINACIVLDKQLQTLEEEIILNPHFIKKNASVSNTGN